MIEYFPHPPSNLVYRADTSTLNPVIEDKEPSECRWYPSKHVPVEIQHLIDAACLAAASKRAKAHASLLSLHLARLRRADERQWCRLMSQPAGLRAIARLDASRIVPSSIVLASISLMLADAVRSVPDTVFATAPRAARWVRTCLDSRRRAVIQEHFRRHLLRSLHAVPHLVAWYGEAKDDHQIYQRARGATGGSTPDLFDTNRFRLVVRSVPDLAILYAVLRERFASRVIRVRNYYTNPRRGAVDPYRALHLCVQLDDEEYVEIQILTENREWIGVIDHSFVCKRRVAFTGSRHRDWLWALSWTSNLTDAIESEALAIHDRGASGDGVKGNEHLIQARLSLLRRQAC